MRPVCLALPELIWLTQAVTPPQSNPSDPTKQKGIVADFIAERPAIPDYELIRAIGRGSYGDVWLARGLTGVYRAIKVVWRDRFPNAEPFEREFKGLKKFMAMARPEAGQLALLHVGQNEAAGFFYYVMELADDLESGGDINPARYTPLTLKEVRTRRGRLPAKECLDFGVELARGLAGLHSRGLVHRDIKPSNVILVGGVAKLADIGLVAATGEALTYVGTEGFLPPEGPGKPGADVFALGRLLYELATGLDREEFPRLPPEMNKIADRKLLLGLNEIILRACEPAADRRYPDAQALLADLLILQAGSPVRQRRRGRPVLALAAGVVVVGAVAVFFFLRRPAPPPEIPAASPVAESVMQAAAAATKSIAVLPFENLSDDKENAFLADGIHEEILTNLANIASLHVISRTSVMQYRGTTKTLGQIARELGVEYVLEGSVRRVGQKVRVTGQLIRAATDQDIWAKAYDGDLSDILALQAQVATVIAEQLKAVLTPAEAKRLTAVTLANPQAYELYLRGKDLRSREKDAMSVDPAAEALFKQATELDPKFALPWVELARINLANYFQDNSLLSARGLAKQALDRAVALAPDRAEVEAGLGEYFYYGFADFDSAAQHYKKALALAPSDARVHNLLGYLARRQGRWREAIAELRQAHELDPLNRPFAIALRVTYSMARAYPEARALTLMLLQSDPDDIKLKLDVAFYNANLTLSRRPLDEWYAALTPEQRLTPEVRQARLWIAYESGNATECLGLAEADPPKAAELTDEEVTFELAIARRALGRDASALLAEQGRRLEDRVRIDPEARFPWLNLALNCALRGDRARAEFALQRVNELVPEDKDHLNWSVRAVTRVQAMAWLGDKDAALDLLTKLVRQPGPELHPYRLKFSLDWWPLRGDPRFEALLADPATYQPQY